MCLHSKVTFDVRVIHGTYTAANGLFLPNCPQTQEERKAEGGGRRKEKSEFRLSASNTLLYFASFSWLKMQYFAKKSTEREGYKTKKGIN